jgi:hypothetical protein
MDGRNRHAGDLANLLRGKHFRSIVNKLIVHSYPDRQSLVVLATPSAPRSAYATAIETSSAAKP